MWGQDHPSSLLPPPPWRGGIITGTASSNYILGLIGMTKSHGPVGRVEKMHMCNCALCNMNSGIHTATNFNCLPLHYPIQNINSAIRLLYKMSLYKTTTLLNVDSTKRLLYKKSFYKTTTLLNVDSTKRPLDKMSFYKTITLLNVDSTKRLLYKM